MQRRPDENPPDRTEPPSRTVASRFYCVRRATLVEPLTAPPASRNRTEIRLAAGSNGTVPLACTKMAKVGVAPAAIGIVMLAAAAAEQAPVAASVGQMARLTGRTASPVSAEIASVAAAPRLSVARAKAAAPSAPGRSRMPSFEAVAERAMMSGVGVAEAESSSVFSPAPLGAAIALPQA